MCFTRRIGGSADSVALSPRLSFGIVSRRLPGGSSGTRSPQGDGHANCEPDRPMARTSITACPHRKIHEQIGLAAQTATEVGEVHSPCESTLARNLACRLVLTQVTRHCIYVVRSAEHTSELQSPY